MLEMTKRSAVVGPASHIVHTRRAGWSLIPRFLNAGELQSLRDDLAAIRNDRDKFQSCMFFYDENGAGQRRLNRIEVIWEALETLSRTSLGQRLYDCAAEYFSEPAALFKDKLNIRYTASKGYAPHQDSAAGWEEFSDRFLTIGVFLDTSDREHGGFEVVSEAHARGRFPNDRGRMDLGQFMALGPIEIIAEAGDALLIDGEAPHRTVENLSDSDNFHLLFTFVPSRFSNAREAYYDKKRLSFASNKIPDGYAFRVFSFE
jgi:hypothetical protein